MHELREGTKTGFAFVSVGLEFSLRGLREAGWRPIAVFALATIVNIVVALGLATVLFVTSRLVSG